MIRFQAHIALWWLTVPPLLAVSGVLPRHSSWWLHMVSHAEFAFCRICILQYLHFALLWDASCETAPIVSGFGPAPCLGLLLSVSSHGLPKELLHWVLCATSVTWSSACHRETAPHIVSLSPTVPGQFKRYERAANSGKIKQSLNCKIQLSLASASELSLPSPLKSPHGFARRRDKDALWCTPYRTARYGKPMPISSSYITHWHNFMLASLAVLVFFYWGLPSRILQFASHHGICYPQNSFFSLSIYLHPGRAVGCS